MNLQSTVLVRGRDVIAALSASRHFGKALSKTDVQKFVYLMDIIGYLYNVLPPSEHHRTYRHGPYDVNLQNAVDSLVFRGLVSTRKVEKMNHGGVRATYELTQLGQVFSNKIGVRKEFKRQFLFASKIAESLQEYGWSRLINMVYGEPTFNSARGLGFGQKLSIQDGLENSAAAVFRVIENLVPPVSEESGAREAQIADIFVAYLDEIVDSQPSA